MVAGQNMSVFSQSIASQYTGATTITLMPQTVNGTVLSATPSGGFTDYTVSLAPDNLFSTLAVQPGQTTLLNNPTVMEIYVDGSVNASTRNLWLQAARFVSMAWSSMTAAPCGWTVRR
jgi:hypothetical protein